MAEEKTIDIETEKIPEQNQVIELPAEELIKNVKDEKSLQEFLSLFNLNIAKKQALRVAKREEILDHVTDNLRERVVKRPDEMTTTDLLNIDKVVSEQKQKELGNISSVSEKPVITLQQNNINIGTSGGLDRDSRERVLEAVKELLNISHSEEPLIEEPQIVETKNVDN